MASKEKTQPKFKAPYETIDTRLPIEQPHKVIWVNEPLVEQGIWWRYKIVEQSISATGDTNIICWFAPKLVIAHVQDSNQASDGKTDFDTTYSIRSYWTGTAFATSESANLISLSNLTWNITRRLYNWFIFNTSSFSGGAKTIYFTCYS